MELMANFLSEVSASLSADTPPAPLVAAPPSAAAVTVLHHETPEPKRSFAERVKEYETIVAGPVISKGRVRGAAFDGVPEANGLRAVYWKLLLNYLPYDKTVWETYLAAKRRTYSDFVKDLIIDPNERYEKHKAEACDPLDVSGDHPLSTDQSSTWNTYFKDKAMLFEIDKDVKRTFPHMHFFQNLIEKGTVKHCEALQRILFIYAKLNPGISYVQGMNEVLAPIYYVLAHDSSANFRENVEADCFFCFTNLMSEIMNHFIKTLDGAEDGIQGTMARLDAVLREKDMQLWANFKEKKLLPQFYSFRWITVLLSQDFELPDVLRLWDSLFADPRRFDFLMYICLAMLVLKREELLTGELGDNIKLLQSYPPTDVNVIIRKARDLRS